MIKPKTEHTPIYRDEKMRGEAARQLLEHPLFAEVNTMLKAKLVETWLRTAPDDVAGREWLHKYALAQLEYHNALTKALQTGEMARMSLADIEATPTPRRRTR